VNRATFRAWYRRWQHYVDAELHRLRAEILLEKDGEATRLDGVEFGAAECLDTLLIRVVACIKLGA